MAQRASSDFGCPKSSIQVRNVGAGALRATGCGKTATYICVNQGQRAVCALDSDITSYEQAAPTRAGVSTAESRLFAEYSDQIRECVSDETISISFDADGPIAEIPPWEGETPQARSCLAHALVGAELIPAPGRATTVVFDPAADYAAPSPQPSTNETEGVASEEASPAAPAPYPGTASLEQELRTALDVRSEDILTCTAADRVALRVEWESGGVEVSLQGELAGSDAEGCVQATLDGELDVPSDESGSLIHLVRRESEQESSPP